MTTHPRARAFQAGAFLALVGGSLVVAPTPALAAKAPSVVITELKSSNLKGGEKTTLKYRVTNLNPLTEVANIVTVAVSVTPGELSCQGDCGSRQVILPGASQPFEATLVAGAMPSGASKTGSVSITVSIGDQRSEASRTVTVRGDDKPPTAKQVSGRLKDQTGKAIGGALVVLVDSQSHQYETRSNGSGSYRFFSSDQQPISPGTMQVGASKDGYESKLASGNATVNQAVKIDLTMVSTATPSPSASPSPSVSTSATPSAQVSDPAEDETPAAPAAAAPQQSVTPASQASSDDGSSLLFLVLGGLLVAAGLGAIVLVILRRKDSGADAEPADEPVAPRPGGAVPAQSRSGRDATRIAGADGTRIGGVGPHPAEATMVTSAPLPPSLSEAATMLQQAVPVEDEYPDPYGAPSVVPHAGYQPARPAAAPAVAVYGAAAPPVVPAARGAAGYPAPAAVAPPVPYGQPAGYGAHPYAAPPAPTAGPTMSAGYGGRQQRYDEPTGMYAPQAEAYQPAEEEYDQAPAAGYAPHGGYDQAGPYDDAGYAHPGYGQAEYPQAGGYGQAGYPMDAEHAQDPGYDQAGYVPAGPGYPQQTPAAVPYQPGGYPEQAQPYTAAWAPVDDQNAYGAPAAGYAPDGYGEPTGYDQGAGYGHAEGYGRAPEQPDPHHGYGEAGYYDQPATPQPGGRHGAAPVPPQQQAGTAPAQRRLDWLDD